MVACATQSLPAWAQSAELDAALKQYQTLTKQGKYAEAIAFAQTFIALAREEFGETHQHYASGLGDLAASGIWAVLLNHRTTSHGTSAFFLMAR
ncbi:MAG: hypothetical protein ACKVIK_14300, partial [Rhodospirillales bacterium]